MATESVEVQIEGGKATAAPPLGPALGPLGINIGQVVQDINKKTADFKGMKVPVKVEVDKDTKEYTISIGTPPASQLIKKEAKAKKGSGNPLSEKVADLKIEQIIKVAKMKEDALLGKDAISRVKEILGTCDSMGMLVEGKQAREIVHAINKGEFVEKIRSGKTELTAEELKALEAERKALEEELKKRKEEFEQKAQAVLKKFEGKSRNVIKQGLIDAGIPNNMLDTYLPVDEKKAAPAAAPAANNNSKKK